MFFFFCFEINFVVFSVFSFVCFFPMFFFFFLVVTFGAHFTLGVRAKKKLGANFEHFWLVVWPQVTNKCENIDVKILINAGTLAPRVANWPPKFDGIFFSILGANTRP